MAFARQTTYGQIAKELRRAILTGEYGPTSNQPDRNQRPGAAELGAKYGVTNKTAARAVQQLVSEGLVLARSGMRPLVAARAQRLDRWPMTGRYARARETLVDGRVAELSRNLLVYETYEGDPAAGEDDQLAGERRLVQPPATGVTR